MSDGEYIGDVSETDTFIDAVWKLGIDNIMRKILICMNVS